ncbi:universal stress protein [Gryllotalpicola reticulitermitis]|uniref:Universal stress protein n=1 Tax=Gryllotalpicola reticulitermitis TaxID=1184153 RepID=A0ABV8Q2Y7_9MICO
MSEEQDSNSTVAAASSAAYRVVVGVDGSQPSVGALKAAARIATDSGATLVAVVAWQMPPFEGTSPSGYSPEDDARRILAEAEAAAFGGELPARYERTFVDHPPVAALIDESRNADLVVVGTRGHGGVIGMLLGSVSAAVAQYAHCPVLIHRPRTS